MSRLRSFWYGTLRGAGPLLIALALGCRAPEVPPVEPTYVLRPSFAALAQGDESAAPSLARDADLLHVSLDLTLDWERRSVSGTATSWVRALRPSTHELRLAATSIEVREVLDAAGRALVWRLEPDTLVVTLVTPLAPGAEEPLRVVYTARPAAGLVFTEGDVPGIFAPELHTHEGEQRHWLPTLVAPGDRATFDARLRIGHDMQLIASGVPVASEVHDTGERTFVWRLAEAVPVASFGFAAGRFVSATTVVDGVPVSTHRSRGVAEHSERAVPRDFEYASDALRFFVARLARPFPFARYDQVIVRGLGVRGLESASASFFDESLVVLDDDALLDLADRPRRTVTHELAHHWFGVHAAPLDRREVWLAEALATWLELEFEAHVDGDEARAVLYEELREELALGVERGLVHAGEVPAHYYSKGPWVLRMIGGLVGEEGLWRIVRTLATRHGGAFFTTDDLRRVAFEETGYELGPLVERWVDGGDLLRLDVGLRPVASGALEVVVAQRGVPFELDLTIQFELADGTRVRRAFPLRTQRDTFTAWFGAAVVDAVVDPDGHVCAAFTIDKGADAWGLAAWARQAAPTSTATARWRAIRTLATLAESVPEALPSLLKMVSQDPAPGVRRRVLERISSRDPRVQPVAMRALESDPDPRVRRAAARALHQLHARGALDVNPAVLERLAVRLQSETSPAVREVLDGLLSLLS
jgi:aminopeptidase N